MTDGTPPRSRAALAAATVLGAAIAYHLALLFVQVRHPFPFLNDSVLHYGLMQSIESAPSRGQSILDPWVSTWCLGFPAFHYYQNLPHLLVVGLAKLAFGALSLVSTFKLVEWLAISTFPLPVFLGMRRLGFDRTAAVSAGILSLWIRTDYLHGHDFESYVWQGLGQYTQAVGGWLFPLAVAWGATAVRDGRDRAKAALLLALTFLSHLAIGYMAYMAVGLFALLSPRDAVRRVGRLALIAGVSVAMAAYVVVPVFRDFAYYNVSGLVPSWKYNSFGHTVILPWFLKGRIFDFGRPSVLTALAGIGFVVTALRSRREKERALLVWFVFFTLLFFGRPTWGSLLDLMPLGKGFHFSRAIFVVHIAGVMMAGVAISQAGRFLWARGRWGRAGAIVAAAAVAWVPAHERTVYLLHNADLVREAADGYAKEGPDLERALAVAREDRLGRVYAGQGRPGQPWGGAFMVGWAPVYSWFPAREMDALGYLHHMWSLNADFHDRFNEGRESDYRAFNVRRIVAPAEGRLPPFAREIDREGRFRVLAVDGPGFVEPIDVPYTVTADKRTVSRVHRAWLRSDFPGRAIYPAVHLAEEGPAPDGAIDGGGVDFRLPPAASPAGSPGEALQVTRTGDDFDARIRMDRAAHVVLKMSFHPGWRATVDGARVKTMQVTPSYLAIALPEGVHDVHFEWAPGPIKPILLGLGLLPFVGLVLLDRRRRS